MDDRRYTKENLCLILNPTAGSGKALEGYEKVKALLQQAGVEYTLFTTKRSGDGTELAKKAVADGFTTVCALGGDGTVREVALGLLDCPAALCILPCGTGNDFIRSLGIPSDMEGAVDTLLYGERIYTHLSMANDYPYINVAGFGFDVDVLDAVDRYKGKTKNGSLAYLKGLLYSIVRFKNRQVRYSIDGGETVSCSCLVVAAGNGSHIGGGLPITPLGDPKEELLDFCIIHDIKNHFQLLPLLPAFLKGKHIEHSKYVSYVKGKSLEASCEPFSRIQVDGERYEGTPVHFRLCPQQIGILVPDRKKEA